MALQKSKDIYITDVANEGGILLSITSGVTAEK
jgi:hypothetical protein